MDKPLVFWTTSLCLGVGAWFYINSSLDIDYTRHPQLVDTQTGIKRKPSDLLDLKRIISPSAEYINSTNSMQRLYDLIYMSNFENPFIVDHTYSNPLDLAVSGWPVANQTRCGRELLYVLNTLTSNPNYRTLSGRLGYELTIFMDSFGKPESATFTGVIGWLGSYKQCLASSLNEGRIKTRYCIGRMRAKTWPKNETIRPRSMIRLGMCLPETCDTNSMERYQPIIERLAKLEMSSFFAENLELESMFCLPDERSPIRQMPLSGYIYIYTVLVWITIILIGTCLFEMVQRHRRRIANMSTPILCKHANKLHLNIAMPDKNTECGKKNASSIRDQILEALSIRCAVKTFKTNTFKVAYKQGDRVRVNLNLLDFFKIAMAIVVILGHSGYLGLSYSRSLGNRIDMSTGYSGRMVLSVSRCVDTFFVFFGVLTSYTIMRKFTLKQLASPLIWIGINVGILTRISPIFMLVYWYSHSVSPYTSSGPWWDYGVDKYSSRGLCLTDAWWKSIPYFGSIGKPQIPACVLPAWFIISYAQISLILPLITYILCYAKTNIARYSLIAFLTLASALNIGLRMYMQTTIKEEGFTLYGGMLTDLLEKFESTGHLLTLGRLGSVSIGCFVGYLLRRYEEGVIIDWPSWLKSKLTFCLVVVSHFVIVFLPMIGHYFYLTTGKMVTLNEFVVFNIATVIIWPILNALLILTGTTIYNHLVTQRFLGHVFWHGFNRLGLCIFLVHWEVIFVAMTNFEQAPTYGFITDVLKTWAFAASVSIVLAFVIHITLEVPLSKLLMVLANTLMQSQQNTTNSIERGPESNADTISYQT